ncbi:sensor histidine kinase [Enterococcus faecalis]|uniref:sensor histidine kinase n=1 Tax=Enterococcus faecalis TaxID=1351 RepID=UPI001785455C|nr:sensor histidine kinase [Enterococcus faecalis]EIT2647418.1 sensor histidine kinase [Enterococcus faecalis]EJC3125450.1 sensor histidine kinase [Enterococcus faecalis]MBD9823972.1 sensor histidine kinase [Enterococcus faecalis]HAP5764710.1 sensor histidine kinase [Enterococcus faecalis]
MESWNKMKRIFKKLFKKKYLLNRLLQKYSLLLTSIILLTVAALCVYVTYTINLSIDSQKNNAVSQIDSYVTNKNNAATNMINELAGSASKIENMRKYMELSPPEYFDYTYRQWSEDRVSTHFGNNLSTLFSTFPDLEEVIIRLDEFDQVLFANRTATNGKKMDMSSIKKHGFQLMRIISDPYTGQPLGELYTVFSSQELLGNQADLLKKSGINAFIYDSAGNQIFSEKAQFTKEEERQLDKRMHTDSDIQQVFHNRYDIAEIESSGRSTILLLTSRRVLFRQLFMNYAAILGIGLLLIVILLVGLNRLFKRYSQQVQLILEATRAIGDGNLKERIDTNQVQEELNDIASAINFMVDSLDQYIHDIYTLEIKQRDAHMRALQSQINPHFLYNTLEYIRMYALSRQQEELADVVYAFSTLLRNNINQEKTTTLAEEISFCEKYVYLYQMRYPDQFAYKFEIEETIADVEIPKFIIQPLVENYFVHGIDYQRQDNAIKVHAYREGEKIIVAVVDNGKGITANRLEEIRERLNQTEIETEQSIGLRNVHERLQRFFGESYGLTIEGKEGEGTTIRLSFVA